MGWFDADDETRRQTGFCDLPWPALEEPLDTPRDTHMPRAGQSSFDGVMTRAATMPHDDPWGLGYRDNWCTVKKNADSYDRVLRGRLTQALDLLPTPWHSLQPFLAKVPAPQEEG